jgi:hypothetical protein
MGNWNQLKLRNLCWKPSTVWVIKWRKIWMSYASGACGKEERLLVSKTAGNSPHELPWHSWKFLWNQNTLGWEELDYYFGLG